MFLSIDIGLRNLAMCLMTASDKNDLTTYSIKLWNVFNTLDSDEYRCEQLQKSGKICNKLCGFTYKDSSNQNIYCCKTHFPKDINITKTNIFKKKENRRIFVTRHS